MPTPFKNSLVIAISSRALFDLSDSHQVYTDKGVDAYHEYQIENENDILPTGFAFDMVKKFLTLNENTQNKLRSVEIVLVSRNSADTGLRIFNSIEHYGLNITRAVFTGGQSPYKYLNPFGAHLFLSADPADVTQALEAGHAAAVILPSNSHNTTSHQLKIAFDGDAVLFSDEAERIYQEEGLEAFTETEKKSAHQPLPGGPFKDVLAALHTIQKNQQKPIIRTALITARSAPAHKRVINTLRAWDIRIDESYFLGGVQKGEFLKTFGADIYFDDQQGHCESARQHVTTGHVPNGITNKTASTKPNSPK